MIVQPVTFTAHSLGPIIWCVCKRLGSQGAGNVWWVVPTWRAQELQENPSHIQIGHVQIPLSLQKSQHVPTESVKGPRESDDWDHAITWTRQEYSQWLSVLNLSGWNQVFFGPLRQCDFASILAQEEMSTKTSPPPTMIKKAWRETWIWIKVKFYGGLSQG